jgi:hypothetical protein
MTTLIPKFDLKNGGSTPAGAVNRTINLKLAETVSVKDFGAVGDGTTDDTTAFSSALATGKSIYLPSGTYSITSSLTVSNSGQSIYGSGFGQSIVKRGNDTSFVIFNVTATYGTVFKDFKIIESSSSLTNTGSYIQISVGASDVLFDGMWFLYGWQQIRCMQGTSDINITNSIFETSRKGSIYATSSIRNRVVSCTFWKNSADISNPSDRGYAINFIKDSGYSFGCSNWSIVANYFAENVYGPFLLFNTALGIQVIGNFFEIASQVDNGVKSDIELTSCSYITIAGNSSDSVVNSYVAGQRGSKYCIDLSGGGNSLITITGNTLQQGVIGTINDPSNVAVIMSNACNQSIPDISKQGISLPNVTKATNVLSWYEEAAWTPYLNFGGAHVGQTYSLQLGTFTRVGRLITLSCSIALSNIGSSTGAATISGFPYQSNSTPTAYIIYAEGGVTLTGQLAMANGGNSLAFSLLQENNGTATALTNTAFTTPTIRFCIQYESV